MSGKRKRRDRNERDFLHAASSSRALHSRTAEHTRAKCGCEHARPLRSSAQASTWSQSAAGQLSFRFIADPACSSRAVATRLMSGCSQLLPPLRPMETKLSATSTPRRTATASGTTQGGRRSWCVGPPLLGLPDVQAYNARLWTASPSSETFDARRATATEHRTSACPLRLRFRFAHLPRHRRRHRQGESPSSALGLHQTDASRRSSSTVRKSRPGRPSSSSRKSERSGSNRPRRVSVGRRSRSR